MPRLGRYLAFQGFETVKRFDSRRPFFHNGTAPPQRSVVLCRNAKSGRDPNPGAHVDR